MRGAAPLCSRLIVAVLGLVALAVAAPSAGADVASRSALPKSIWALELDGRGSVGATMLRTYRRRGFDAVVVDARHLSASRLGSIRRGAAGARMQVLSGRGGAPAGCGAVRRRGGDCVLTASSLKQAVAWARTGRADLVVVRVADVRHLTRLGGRPRGRILALARLDGARFDARDWADAARLAAQDPRLDLGVRARASRRGLATRRFASVLGASRKSPSGTTPARPAAPAGLRLVEAGQTSVTLAWQAAVGSAEYGIYRDGAAMGTTGATSISVVGLACGTGYLFEVDSASASGQRSGRTPLRASTAACGGGGGSGGGGGGDSQAPTTPTGLVRSAATPTSITLDWSASNDNIGVSGYGLYRNNAFVGSTAATTAILSGLACGTNYSVAVDAYDTAGNRSGRATLTAGTAACGGPIDTQAPTVPQGLRITTTTQTTVTMAWNASSDNVGVVGYRLYRNDAPLTTTTQLSYTYTGLTCGATYSLSIEAFDAAGNASYRPEAVAPATTAACGGGGGDSTAPTTPSGLSASAVSQSGATLGWSASSDNVGVVGYGRYRDGVLVSSGTGTSFAFSGLGCGSTYLLGVDAYDAAGNRSGRAQLSVSTSACSGAPPGSAQVWLDTNGGSCTRSAVPGGYVDGQACGSMQAAVNAALSGDTINIVDGVYGGQSFSGSKSLSFRAAGPGRPSFGQIISAAANVTVRGILIENRNAQPIPYCNSWILDYTLFVCAPNQTYDDVIVDGKRHPSPDPERRGGINLSGNSTGFTFKNGEIRGVWDSKGFQGGADNMVLENNLWQDIRITDAGGAAGVHNECAYIAAGDNQVWRGNRFINCPIMAMFFANYSGGPPFSGVLIENNLFTHATNDENGNWHDGSSFVIPNGTSGQNQVNNWVIRFNTFEVAPLISRTPGTGDDNGSALFYGNLGAAGGCGNPEWRYSYNVGSVCGGTGDVSVPNATNSRNAPNQAPFYVNAPAGDFRLRSGANPALNIGAPTYPGRDLDNNPRPYGPAPDAGAYERQS